MQKKSIIWMNWRFINSFPEFSLDGIHSNMPEIKKISKESIETSLFFVDQLSKAFCAIVQFSKQLKQLISKMENHPSCLIENTTNNCPIPKQLYCLGKQNKTPSVFREFILQSTTKEECQLLKHQSMLIACTEDTHWHSIKKLTSLKPTMLEAKISNISQSKNSTVEYSILLGKIRKNGN